MRAHALHRRPQNATERTDRRRASCFSSFPVRKTLPWGPAFLQKKGNFKKVLGKLSANSWAKGHLAGTKGTLSRQTQDCAHGDEAVRSGAPQKPCLLSPHGRALCQPHSASPAQAGQGLGAWPHPPNYSSPPPLTPIQCLLCPSPLSLWAPERLSPGSLCSHPGTQ